MNKKNMKYAPAELYRPPIKYRMIVNRKMLLALLDKVSIVHGM